MTGDSLIKKLSMVFSPGQAPTCYRTGSAAEQRINGDTPQPHYCYYFLLLLPTRMCKVYTIITIHTHTCVQVNFYAINQQLQ